MTEATVLIVDDDFHEWPFFKEAFGDHAVTVCKSVDELGERLKRGATWDVAFVDFDLSEKDPELAPDLKEKIPTGLSALKLLRERSDSPVVSYTRMGESGRALYCAAAKSWFGANASMDKSLAIPENLQRYVRELGDGRDPTVPLRRAQLARTDLINELLPDAMSLRLWREYYKLDGREDAIQRALPGVTGFTIRKFKGKASDAVIQFEKTFFGREVPATKKGEYDNLKGVITKFAGAHRNFFNAVDLDRALSWRDGH